MERINTDFATDNRLAHIESHKGLSDSVIIEIVHGIKEIIIKFIEQKYQHMSKDTKVSKY